MGKTITADEIKIVKKVEYIDDEYGFLMKGIVKPSKVLELIGDNEQGYDVQIIANNIGNATVQVFSRAETNVLFIDFGTQFDLLPIKLDNKNAPNSFLMAIMRDM